MPLFVPKLRVPVRACQTGQEPIDGFLTVGSQAEFHPGPETVLERLNANDRVIPFLRRSDEAMLLLSRMDIEWVVLGSVDAELAYPRNHFVTREEQVRLRFTSGEEMDGLIQMELPEMLNRASDFLNGVDDFFPLVTRDGVVLVNKNRVLETRLYESSPLPLVPESPSGN